jgi:hypothetical protein
MAAKGVETAQDFANMMSALMSDVIEGKIAPPVASATCRAASNLLRVVELQYKYGKAPDGGQPQNLMLAQGS